MRSSWGRTASHSWPSGVVAAAADAKKQAIDRRVFIMLATPSPWYFSVSHYYASYSSLVGVGLAREPGLLLAR